MARPVDWTPLGYDSDPVPGDPDRVLTMGKHYQEVADAINEAAAKLRTIAESDMISQAVDEFRDSCEKVADDISRAHTRYRGVGDALVAYAPGLDYAQEESAAALRDAESAQDEIRTNQASLDRLESADDPDTGAVSRAEGRMTDAETALTRAKTRAEEAVGHRDTQAGRAIDEIEDVKDSGDLNDSWWDNWGADIVKVIVDVASAVATVAGVLSLFLGWVPILGQALTAIALLASAIALLGSIALAATGHGSWGAVVLNAIGVASFGIGRAVGAAAKVSFRGARGAGRLAAGRMAARSPAFRAARSMPATSSSRTAIQRLVGSPSIANLSRHQARNMAAASRAQGWAPSAGNAWRAIRDGVTDMKGLFNRQAWAQGVTDFRTVGSQIVTDFRSGNIAAGISRGLGQADVANGVNALRGMSTPLVDMAEVSSHVNRAVIHGSISLGHAGAGGVSSSVNLGDQVIDVVTGSDPDLNLPSDPAVPAR